MQLRLSAERIEHVRAYLSDQRFHIKSLTEEIKLSYWERLKKIELGGSIKAGSKIQLLKNLGQMINRGYSLERVIEFLLVDERDKAVIRLLKKLQKKANRGYRDYEELFRELEQYFDEEFFSVLIAGQKTGTVGQNLIDYAVSKEKLLLQKKTLINLLGAKFFVLGIVLVAFVVIVSFVVPQFMDLFGEKLDLPWGMKIMVAISDLFRNHGVMILGGVIFLSGMSVSFYKLNREFRFFAQKIMLKLPILGGLFRMIETRNFLYMMGNLISKGVSILESIRILIEQTSNLCFQSVYMAIEAGLKKGKKLDQILGVGEDVPKGYLLESVAQAMTLGAQGGNLAELLNEGYQTYDLQLQSRMDMGIKLIGVFVSLITYAVIIFMIASLALTLFMVMEDPGAVL